MMDRFIPFTKIDEERRMVYGIASDETPDNQDEIVDYEATKAAVADWQQWRNVREMHRPSAVGIAEEIVLNDLTRSLEIGVRVVDDAAWQKAKEGVYKGFSIGGRKLKSIIQKMDGRSLTRIIKYILAEISLVDRPANPTAIFTVVKRDNKGGTMTIKQQLDALVKRLRGEETNSVEDVLDALEKAINSFEVEPGLTAEDVQKAVEVHFETIGQAFAKTDQVDAVKQDISQAVEELAKAQVVNEAQQITKLGGDVQALAGDLAKAITEVTTLREEIETRLVAVEKATAGQGPVLREIGHLMTQPNGQAAVLKSLFDETNDPNLRQVIGQKLAEMQIRATPGQAIGF